MGGPGKYREQRLFDAIAQTLSRMGYPVYAMKLTGAAAAIREHAKVKLTAYERANLANISPACRAALGDKRLASAWAEGQGLTLEQAINLVLERVSLQI